LVFFSCAALLISYRWFQFGNLSYGLFTVFLSLHLLGAHYTYSQTPVGFWLQDWFGWERNHYDRIVHFSFGFLIVYPLRELLLRASGIKRSWSYFMAVMVIMAFSDLYEVIEGGAALIVDPELGVAFVGAQGDIWDAQKDTFLAFVGSVLAMLISWLWQRKNTA
jgi:putative membrane protein